MRIGIFTETYTPYISGLVTSEVMLKKALEKLGHEVYVVTANLENFKYSYDEKEHVLKIPGIPTGIYDSRLTGIYPIKAIKKIKSWDLDVIHSQTEFAIGTFARIFGKQYNVPVVHTYHTMYEDYVHYITKGYFTKPGIKLVEYLTKFYCDKTVTELIVPTKKAYDLFKEKYKVDRNIHIIPTGIEIERFYKENSKIQDIIDLRRKLGIYDTDFVILFVGRLAEEKDVETLIEGQQDINKKCKNAKLLIVGDGPDIHKYKELSKKLKVEDTVIFTGKVPWDDMPKYYQLSDLFATASRSETQGLTVVEALAAEVPVVCADDDSFKIVIIDDLNGKLFKNKKEYVKITTNLIGNKEKLARMGKQARISAEPYSSKYFAEQVLKVYETAIGPNKKDRSFFGKLKSVVKRGLHEK